jgi:hypothetical protein
MLRKRGDWLGNIVALAVVLLVNVLSNALPINGQTMAEISDGYPSLFTPAGFTFSIWGLIYLALIAFVLHQALPGQRDNAELACIGGWFKANCAANALWIIVWHYHLLWLSVAVMACILWTLVAIYRSLGIVNLARSRREQWLVQFPFGLYCGWITVATLANLSALQNGMGWDNTGFDAVTWTQLKLAIAGAIGATVVLRRADTVFILVIAWAAFGIAVKHSDEAGVAGAASMLWMFCLCMAGLNGIGRWRRRRLPA